MATLSLMKWTRRAFFALMQCACPAASDDHLQLCHGDFLRFYRVKLKEKDQQGDIQSRWSHWVFIDTRDPDDRANYESNMTFFRDNSIEVQFHALPGKLPD